MNPLLRFLFCSGFLAALGVAQTVTVITVEDVVDVSGNATVADLPGPDGLVSFREAVIAANNTPGPQTIAFAIPRADWWLFTQYAALKLELGVFFLTDDGTTLDFTTQTTFTGDTNPDGNEVGIYGLQPNGWGTPAIIIVGSDCVVRGLGPVSQRGAAVSIDGGARNRVVGCITSAIHLDPQPGTTHDNVIGGTAPGDGNVLEEVWIACGADDNIVVGNQLETVSVVGSQYCASEIQYPRRNRIGGPAVAERNVIAGAGYRSSEGFPTGENVKVYWARDTRIEGNYIGVTPDGLQRFPQVAPTGIYVADSFDTLVRDNLVAGMYVIGSNHYAGRVFGRAIWINAINADTVGVTLAGNKIGVDANGGPILTFNGIRVDHSTASRSVRDVMIGGLAAGSCNRVAFTERTGIAVLGSGAEAEISGNSIHDNGLLAIDLGTFWQGVDGVTPNDAGDVDTGGGNELQNFPVLSQVFTAGGGVAIHGALNSQPQRGYRLEFFANPGCDPSGHGEAETFLGALTVMTDAAGNATFVARLNVHVPVGTYVTATATALTTARTSECSACVEARFGSVLRTRIAR